MTSTPRLFGPKRVPPNGQIQLPKELMEHAGIQPDANVYLIGWQGRVLVMREEELQEWLKSHLEDDFSA
jgi:hypothetical protein